MAKKQIGNVVFGIGLAIILFALFNLGVGAFYEQPKYETYCNVSHTIYTDQASCTTNGGFWTAGNPGYCDLSYYCSQNYQSAYDKYNNTVFYIFVGLGLALSIFGFYIKKKKTFQITSIATGFSLIVEGIVRNYQNKIPAFIAGLIAFAVLGYFINKKYYK